MTTNFKSRSWLKNLALAVGLTTVLASFAASALAQGNPGQPQFGGQPPQYGQPQYGDPSQFAGPPQYGQPPQFGQQQQFNRPQQPGPAPQFGGQNPAGAQGQFGPPQQFNRPPQFRGQGQFGSQNNFRGPNGSMQGRGPMPRTVGGSQRGQFNRPQGMPGGNPMYGNAMYANQLGGNQMGGQMNGPMGGNPGMNRNALGQNGNMQGMNRGPSAGGNPGFMGGGPNPGFNPQANPQGGQNFMNQNPGQSFQGQQFQGQQFQAPPNQGQQFQGPQNQGQQFQGPQNPGQQFPGQQFQGPEDPGQFGPNFTQASPNAKSGQFCPDGTCPAGACQDGNCKHCPNGICSARPAFGQPQGNVQIGNVQIGNVPNGVMAPESDDADGPAPIDLVLKNVELAFPGNPATQQGPVFRVTVLNKSSVAIEDAFEVGLIATNGGNPDDKSPAAGERIASIAAGQVAVVEVQLPVEVNQMGKSEAGEPQPFTTLIVVVDARQEITESDKSNNATKLPRTGIRSVQTTQISGNF